MQSFPRALWIDRSGKQLIQWPVEEIEALRQNEVKLEDTNLKPGSVLEIHGITAAQVCTLCIKKCTLLEDGVNKFCLLFFGNLG